MRSVKTRAAGAVLPLLHRTVGTKKEGDLEGKAPHVLVGLCPCSRLGSGVMGHG